MISFEIPEMLEHIGYYLPRQDLAACARVNKTWHSLLAPTLWRSIPPRPLSPSKGSPTVSDFKGSNIFRRLVRDDYLSMYHNPQAERSSVLSRCGPWIQELALFQAHLKYPPSQREQEQEKSSSLGTVDVVPEPTEHELLLHLLKYCSNLTSLTLVGWNTESQHAAFWRTIVTEVVPPLQEFEKVDVYSETEFLEDWQPVFTHCSSSMRKLKFSLSWSLFGAAFELQEREDIDVEDIGVEDMDVEVGEALVELKDLDVSALGPGCEWSEWSVFLRRCVRLESLKVTSVDRWWSRALHRCIHLRRLAILDFSMASCKVLTDVLKTDGLPNLDDIMLKFGMGIVPNTPSDQSLADALSACRKGWRSIDISILYPRSADALIKDHCGTLECLYAEETSWLTSTQLYRLLSSSPNLHTFSILEDGPKWLPPTPARFKAEDFIDLDPTTDTLRPWPCEPTLKIFRAKVALIPRPDVTHTYHGFPREGDYQYDEFDEEPRLEDYRGQGRDLQRRVYERLSRFKRLEVLSLGHDDRDTRSFVSGSNYNRDAQGVDVFFDDKFQYECLSISLQGSSSDDISGGSGMELLAEMKDLRELNVHRMATTIGVEEVRWMTKSWPKLRVVRGLKTESEGERRAEEWLTENCPWIVSEPCTFLRSNDN